MESLFIILILLAVIWFLAASNAKLRSEISILRSGNQVKHTKIVLFGKGAKA